MSQEDPQKGYRGKARASLTHHGIAVWDLVRIRTADDELSGLVLPRSTTEDDEHIVLKLESGYNIGVRVSSVVQMVRTGRREGHYAIPEQAFPTSKRKRNVVLLGTGGTIASRLDYKTGAVVPAFSPGELYGAVPELADICNLSTKKLFGVFSENMGREQYIALAEEIGRLIADGVHGIVIGHGTDTMHHTASILSFMVQDAPIPIVLVGSQRSSDRPSSDAARNLLNAVYTAAHADLAEVMVCMFGPTSDDYGLLHLGTRVRKMHSSYRSTFRTIGEIPLAMVFHARHVSLGMEGDAGERLSGGANEGIGEGELGSESLKGVVPLRPSRHRRKDRRVKICAAYDDRVALLYYYPGMDPDMIEALIEKGYHGIVIAGTGLGHVNAALNDMLKKAIDQGIAVVMTVQTLWGYVHMNVYDTGRYLLKLGIIPCENMLPEAAYMKLCWVLGQTRDLAKVREMMLCTIAHEMTEREPHNGYLIYQGGIPEVERFLSTYKK